MESHHYANHSSEQHVFNTVCDDVQLKLLQIEPNIAFNVKLGTSWAEALEDILKARSR
jgi:hypothetical protein